jgi:AraC-like DNA-binding protein
VDGTLESAIAALADPSLAGRLLLQPHDSALGRWTEAVCLPPPVLAGLVAGTWLGEGHVAYQRGRLLPRGCSFLLINLGPPQYLVAADGRRRIFRDAWFCGQQQGFLEIEAPHGTLLLGVAFAPAGAYGILGVAQRGLAGEVVELTALLGDRISALRQRLLETDGPAARLALVERWLCERAAGGRAVDPLTSWAARRLASSAGQGRIERLADAGGVSRQRLHALFREQIGLSPKALARIHRFQHALALLRHQRLPAAEVAAACGYFDQSHLIRDLKQLSGCTPGELGRAVWPDDATLVVA